ESGGRVVPVSPASVLNPSDLKFLRLCLAGDETVFFLQRSGREDQPEEHERTYDDAGEFCY
ncbi:MAG: hypothetical protein EBR93_03495, partial [Bacteroidetes bacterium]|nr:hypothetical protein [Bacteroidota bacterium]